jgi:hypothetical protein
VKTLKNAKAVKEEDQSTDKKIDALQQKSKDDNMNLGLTDEKTILNFDSSHYEALLLIALSHVRLESYHQVSAGAHLSSCSPALVLLSANFSPFPTAQMIFSYYRSQTLQ